MVTVIDAETRREHFRREALEWLTASVPSEWRENRGALNEEDETRLRSLWDRLLHAGGYAGLSLPTEYGGQGLGLEEEVIFHELAARVQAPDGLGRIGKILAAPTLIALGTEQQRARYLPKILSGEHVWCQGFSEPGAGSDLASVSTTATKTEGGYLIRGTKIWTSFSKHAQKCLLLAKTDPDGPRHHNLTFFLLDMQQPGVRIEPIRQMSGNAHFSETHLDDAFVSDDDVLGRENEGWTVTMTVLANERGIVEGITRYIEIRSDVDLLLTCCAVGDERVPRLDARTEVVRWQVNKAVAQAEDEVQSLRSSAVLKVWWSELWQQVTNLGSTVDCSKHREHWRHQYLESRSSSIYSGTSEIQRNIVAERVLGLPR